MSNLQTLLIQAQDYQRRGMTLPLDLYAKLLARGVNAALYNAPISQQQEIDFGSDKILGDEITYDQAADILAQEAADIDREIAELDQP